MRYQQVYAAADFVNIIPEGGMISHLRFFVDPSSFGFPTGPLRKIQVNLSTTSKAVDGLSTVFSDNIGANNTTVFGAGSLLFLNDMTIPLSTPFYYNPQLGNLYSIFMFTAP